MNPDEDLAVVGRGNVGLLELYFVDAVHGRRPLLVLGGHDVDPVAAESRADGTITALFVAASYWHRRRRGYNKN